MSATSRHCVGLALPLPERPADAKENLDGAIRTRSEGARRGARRGAAPAGLDHRMQRSRGGDPYSR